MINRHLRLLLALLLLATTLGAQPGVGRYLRDAETVPASHPGVDHFLDSLMNVYAQTKLTLRDSLLIDGLSTELEERLAAEFGTDYSSPTARKGIALSLQIRYENRHYDRVTAVFESEQLTAKQWIALFPLYRLSLQRDPDNAGQPALATQEAYHALSRTTGQEAVRQFLAGKLDYLPGQPLPDLELTDLDGNPIRTADYRGRYLLLDFWSTYCKPCVKSKPDMVRLRASYPEAELAILSISSDTRKRKLVDWIEEHAYNWQHALRGGKNQQTIAGHFINKALPTYYLIDPTGRVVYNSRLEFDPRNLFDRISTRMAGNG